MLSFLFSAMAVDLDLVDEAVAADITVGVTVVPHLILAAEEVGTSDLVEVGTTAVDVVVGK